MKRGKTRFGLLFFAALAFASPLFGPLAADPALAKPPAPAHAKPKPKKPKPAAKSPHHAAGGASKSSSKAHATHVTHATHAANPSAPAAPQRPSTDLGLGDAIQIRLPIQRVTLENGLRVVMSVDTSSSAVAVSVAYDVGSRDEAKGHRGSARLLERLMFQGSQNVLPGDHARLISSRGGRSTSSTGTDVTLFSETLPSSDLALALWLEADRMRSLDMKADAFEAERRAALAEARAALGSAPLSSGARMNELIFQGSWAYEHGPLGTVEDLAATTLDDLVVMRKGRYGPNNAALVIVGDFDPDGAMALVHKHFDAIGRVSATPFAESEVPEQTAQRTAVVHGDDVKSPEVRYGWAIPESRSVDRSAVELAAIVLADGESSRLYQALVRDKAAAEDVSATLTPTSRGPGSLRITARLADGSKVGDVEKLIEGELKKLGAAPPSEAELVRARRRARSSFVALGLSTLSARADRLAAYEVVFGSALPINEELPKIAAITGEDVRKAAARYLGPTRRTLVETYPTGAPASVQTAEAPRASEHVDNGVHRASAKSHASKPASIAKKKKKTAASAKPKKPKKS